MTDLNIILMYTTVSNHADAETLATKLITAKLAICVNIMAPHTAIYQEGDVCHNNTEVGMLIKIPEDRYAFAYDAIKGWHPYAIPALLSWPAEVNPAYSFWVQQQTSMRF